MKRVLLLLAGLFVFNCALADTAAIQPISETSYKNIQFEDCTKMYDTDKKSLFYLAIGAVNANKFGIEEVQTQNGYIIFSTGKNKYIITVAGIDDKNSIIKISPCNNLYYFQPGIISNIYKYIDLNKDLIK